MARIKRHWFVRGQLATTGSHGKAGRPRCKSCGFTVSKDADEQCAWCIRRDEWDTQNPPGPEGVPIYEVPSELKDLLLRPILKWESVEVTRLFKKHWQVRRLGAGKTVLLTLRRWWGHPRESIRLRPGGRFDLGLQMLHSPADPLGLDSGGLVRKGKA